MWLAPAVPLDPWISGGAAPVLGWFLIPFASFVAQGAGEDSALKERGRWVEAKVVAVENDNSNKNRQCTLRKPNGQEVVPGLKEGDGCEDGVERGEVVRVRYDPEGLASPEGESWKPGSYGVVIAVLGTVFVGFGRLRHVRPPAHRGCAAQWPLPGAAYDRGLPGPRSLLRRRPPVRHRLRQWRAERYGQAAAPCCSLTAGRAGSQPERPGEAAPPPGNGPHRHTYR